MLGTFLVLAVCNVTFMETTVGRRALVDQWERTALAFGQEVDDDRYAELTRLSEYGAAYAVLSALLGGPVLAIVIATLVFGVFSSVLGGSATYAQVLAVVAHAGAILALRQVVATPVNYARESLASPTTLGLFFPMLDEASPAARFLGAIDLFVAWWVIVLAIGVALLYRRSAGSIGLAFMGVYVGVAAGLAIAMTLSGGAL